jgi:hypothetical protein
MFPAGHDVHGFRGFLDRKNLRRIVRTFFVDQCLPIFQTVEA